MKILITGANGDIGEAIGRILKEVLPDATISGCDSAGPFPGGFVFNEMLQTPFASAPEYLDYLHELKNKFDLIIPTSEPEIERLSQLPDARDQFPLLMVSSKIVNTFLDKYETVRFFQNNGIKSPKTKLFTEVENSDLPVYVKPRRGAGGRGHRLIKTYAEWQSAKLIAKEDWIAQEYLSGEDMEYTCALYRNDNSFRSIVLKRQLQGDKTIRAEVVSILEIDILLQKIAEMIDLVGCINVQLRMTSDGPRVFEINPRLSSTVMMRHRLGFRDCEWWVRDFFGVNDREFQAPRVGSVAYRMSIEHVIK
jgi:carbamoyl-phosphate synthase large subunit